MIIKSIQKYKGTSYEVAFQDGRKLYLHRDIIADYDLYVELEISVEKIREIIAVSNKRKAFQYSLYLLDYRDYSYKELFKKLNQTYKDDEVCAETLDKLQDLDLINDVRYAERLARKYVEVKRFGFRRAKQEMYLKGIDNDISENALEDYDELYYDNIEYLLENKYCRYLQDSEDRKNIAKVKNALVRYGYSFDDINSAIREYFEE